MPFEFEDTDLPGVVLIHSRKFSDSRGHLLELFKTSEFTGTRVPTAFVQENLTRSRHRVLRGMHYQLDPYAQGKLIYVPEGKIFDVALDIRAGSPTYGRWQGWQLSDENHDLLYIPPGFAHGFQALSPQALVIYKMTAEYDPACERGILWDDPALDIDWPLSDPILSEKDRGWPRLQDAENNFFYQERS